MASEKIWRDVLSTTSAPQEFFSANPTLAASLRSTLSNLVDFTMQNKKTKGLAPIQQLVQDGFDSEGIWAQLSMIQAPVLTHYSSDVKGMLKSEEKTSSSKQQKQQRSTVSSDDDSEEIDASDDSGEDSYLDDDGDGEVGESEEEEVIGGAGKAAKVQQSKSRRSHEDGHDSSNDEGDDGSEFSLNDMEAFADEGEEEFQRMLAKSRGGEERRGEGRGEEGSGEESDSDESVDLFAPLPADDTLQDEDSFDGGAALTGGKLSKKEKQARLAQLLREGPRYEDLFGPKAAKSTHNDDDADGETDEDALELEDGDDKASFSSGDSDDKFIDAGLGVDGEDFDDEDVDDEEDEEDDGESETSSMAALRHAKRVRFDAEMADTDSSTDEDAGPKKLSRHEQDKKRMAEQIAALEQEALSKKHWSQLGEADAKTRPQNSLLDATLEYQQAVKLAPQVTVERTQTLEELIKQRIVDEAFDDPERKVDDSSNRKEKKEVDVSTEKSALGLGDIYAADYAKQIMGVKEDDPVQKIELEARSLMQDLFRKLDALSNFFFTPKMPKKELSIKANAVPALTMEETLPMVVSDAVAAAPEEIHERKTGRAGVLKTVGEKSASERGADRRAKKSAHKKVQQSKDAAKKLIEQSNLGLGNKHAKEKVMQSIKSGGKASGAKVVLGGGMTTSGAKRGRDEQNGGSSTFFAKLQSEARAAISGERPSKKPRTEDATSGKRAVSFKL